MFALFCIFGLISLIWLPIHSNEYNLTRPIDKCKSYTLSIVTHAIDQVSHANYCSSDWSLRGRDVSCIIVGVRGCSPDVYWALLLVGRDLFYDEVRVDFYR